MTRATVFAPATIGNVGPGFDVLGLAVEGLGDVVTVELGVGAREVEVSGRDAALVPREPERNAAWLAARAYLAAHGEQTRPFSVRLEKGLPVSGGLGGSAASSVGGALAAAFALGRPFATEEVLEASMAGESAVAGRHWDNLAPCLLGGLCLIRAAEPLDVVRLEPGAPWWVALVSPRFQLETRAARQVLPQVVGREVWVRQMANTSGVLAAFLRADAALLRRSLEDVYAEPHRAPLIPQFAAVKGAALAAGALGCSISGAGPTVFALCEGKACAERAAAAMQEAFLPLASSGHVGAVALEGARRVER